MAATVDGGGSLSSLPDIHSITDEDELKRLWQRTEDFSKKKEIRARMYKVREQRLREFYTTGEVRSDVLTSNTIFETGNADKCTTGETFIKNRGGGPGLTTTHAGSLADDTFMSLKSKEIRDSESPTREITKSGGSWKMSQESSCQSYSSRSVTDSNGKTTVCESREGEHRTMAADSNIGGGVATRSVQRNADSNIAILDSSDNKLLSSNIEDELFSNDNNEKASVNIKSSSSSWVTSSKTSKSSKIVQSSSSSRVHSSSTTKIEENKTLENVSSAKSIKDDNNPPINIKKQYSESNKSTDTTDNFGEVTVVDDKFKSKKYKTENIQKLSDKNKTAFKEEKIFLEKDDKNMDFIINEKSRKLSQTDQIQNENEINDKIKINKEQISSKQFSDSSETFIKTERNKEMQLLDDIKQMNQDIPVTPTPSTPSDAPNWTVVSTETKKNNKSEFIYSKEPGDYRTTYNTDYVTPRRISKEISPTHEAFARSLRQSPPSSRSSSKTSLDRCSPDRSLRQSPIRRSNATISPLASPRSSPVKAFHETPKIKSTSSSPEKTPRASPTRSYSPSKTPTYEYSNPKLERSPNRSPTKNLLDSNQYNRSTSNTKGFVPVKSNTTTDYTKEQINSNKRNSISKIQTEKENSTIIRKTSSQCVSPIRTTSPIKRPQSVSPNRGKSPSKFELANKNKETYFKNDSVRKSPDLGKKNVIDTETSATYTSDKILPRKLSETSINSSSTVVIKSKRKLSSTNNRTASKKRSSTPGVSPSPSSTEVCVTKEHQSRPRSRGSSRSSNSDFEDNTSFTKPLDEYNDEKHCKNIIRENIDTKPSILSELRNKSPEYSSEGSVANEIRISSQKVKEIPEKVMTSSDTSPVRSAFSPIKGFRTSPEFQQKKPEISSDVYDIKNQNQNKRTCETESKVYSKTEVKKTNEKVLKRPQSFKKEKSYNNQRSPSTSPERIPSKEIIKNSSETKVFAKRDSLDKSKNKHVLQSKTSKPKLIQNKNSKSNVLCREKSDKNIERKKTSLTKISISKTNNTNQSSKEIKKKLYEDNTESSSRVSSPETVKNVTEEPMQNISLALLTTRGVTKEDVDSVLNVLTLSNKETISKNSIENEKPPQEFLIDDNSFNKTIQKSSGIPKAKSKINNDNQKNKSNITRSFSQIPSKKSSLPQNSQPITPKSKLPQQKSEPRLNKTKPCDINNKLIKSTSDKNVSKVMSSPKKQLLKPEPATLKTPNSSKIKSTVIPTKQTPKNASKIKQPTPIKKRVEDDKKCIEMNVNKLNKQVKSIPTKLIETDSEIEEIIEKLTFENQEYYQDFDDIRLEQEIEIESEISHEALRSSRDSSPEFTRRPFPIESTDDESGKPRFADRISEPEEDDMNRPKPFVKPIIISEPLEEFQEFARISEDTQVTDLDDNENEETFKNVCVADRVNKFLNNVAKANTTEIILTQNNVTPEINTTPGSPSTVRSAKQLFENYSTTDQNEKVKQIDILSRPSIFEGRKLEQKKQQEYSITNSEENVINKKDVYKINSSTLTRTRSPDKLSKNEESLKKQPEKLKQKPTINEFNLNELSAVDNSEECVKKDMYKVYRETDISSKADKPSQLLQTFNEEEKLQQDLKKENKNKSVKNVLSRYQPQTSTQPQAPSKNTPIYRRKDAPVSSRFIPKEDTIPVRKETILKSNELKSTSMVLKANEQKTNKDHTPKRQKSISPQRDSDTHCRPIDDISNDRRSVSPKRRSPERKQSVQSPIEKVSSTKRISSPSPKREYENKENSPENQSKKRQVSPSKDTTNNNNKKINLQENDKKEVITPRGNKFGVALRQTNSRTNILQRRSSELSKPKQSEEVCIEDILDLQLLESMLEKVIGYDQRRRIRAQIRLVRRNYETNSSEISTTITKNETYQNVRQRSPTRESPKDSTPGYMRPSKKCNEYENKSIKKNETIQNVRQSSPTRDNSVPEYTRLVNKKHNEYEKTTKHEVRQRSPTRESANDSVPGYINKKNFEQKEHTLPRDNIPGYMRTTKSQEQKDSHQIHTQHYEHKLNNIATFENKINLDNEKLEEIELTPTPKGNIPGYMKPTKTFQENVEISKKRYSNDDVINKTSKIHVTLETRKVKNNEGTKCTKTQEEESFYLNRSSSPHKKLQDDNKHYEIKNDTSKIIKRAPSPKKSYEKLTNTFSNVDLKRNQKSTIETRERSSSPQKNDHHDSFTKKTSKTEILFEVKSPLSVKSTSSKPQTQTDSPRESCPTDSITSSYGVGPTDENGRPLFGLRALRRTNTGQISLDVTDMSPSSETPTKELTPQSPTNIYDSSGRPLFGGLRALKASSTRNSQSKDEIEETKSTTYSTERRSSETSESRIYSEDLAMPEQPVSPQLKDLVNRHELQAKWQNESKGASAPREKPKAKLRDSFILSESTDSNVTTTLNTTEERRVISHRTASLKDIIDKHEKRVSGENESVEVLKRPGILKKPREEVQTKSHSTTTVMSSQGILRPDGTMSVKRDVIHGESSSVNDEPPVTKVTRSYYTYETPESQEKEPMKIESIDSCNLESEDGQENKQKKFTSSATLVRKSSAEQVQKSKVVERTSSSKSKSLSKSSEDSSGSSKSPSSKSPTRSERKSSGTGDTLEGRSSPNRRSSTSPPLRKSSGTTSSTETNSHRAVSRGNSVRALSEKFMKAAENGVSGPSKTTYPKAGLIYRSASFRTTGPQPTNNPPASPTTKQQTPSICSTETTQKSDVDVKLSSSNLSSTTQTHRSFLDNRSRVTGVHDVLERMRNADLQNVNMSEETCDDQEARALLNKFLGASVLLSGLDACGVGGSAALVSQVERQRILKSSSTTQSSNNNKEVNLEELESIWDERTLRQLLENSSDYEDRRKIRARLRTVMAEQKACANIVAEVQADQQRISSDETGSGESHMRQGESQLLPLLVQQLRSSFLFDNSVDQKTNFEDSGTESGEDLKLLAAGIRDSIELQRGAADGKQDDSSDSIGPRILEEVLSALARLQNSLQSAHSLYDIEQGRRENLLQLVTRLQTSLKMPAPPWGPPPNSQQQQQNIPKRFAPGGSQTRRLNRQARHTVGVSREELADARRLLEQGENSSVHDSLKRGSCGDVEIPGVGSAFRAYRPVHFAPQRTNSGNNLAGEFKSVPFPFVEKSQPIKPYPNLVQSKSLDNSSKDIGFNKELMKFNYKNILDTQSSFKKKLVDITPLTAVAKEFKPGKIGEECQRPLKSVSQSSSAESVPGSKLSTPQTSNSGNSMPTQQNKSISQTSSSRTSKESTPFGSDREKHDVKTITSTTNGIEVYSQNPKLSIDLSIDNRDKISMDNKTMNSYIKSEINNVETPSLETDPSLLLFTPSQAAQIAIHKAAINKQISMEEDKRRESNSRKNSIDIKHNSKEGRNNDHNSSSEGDISSDEEEPPNTLNLENENYLNKNQIVLNQNAYNNETSKIEYNQMNPSQNLLLNRINNDSTLNNDQKTSKMLADSWISPECRQNYDNLKTYQVHHEPSGFVLTSAQRLLQLASDQNDKKPRMLERKVKMKRANTIDIPKPLNFYAVEDESDYSSEDEFQNKQNISNNPNQRPSYYSLQGHEGQPIAPPEFQPKTDNDKKFLNFLQKQNELKGDKSETKLISYNPSARGGHHWSNRFSNIKTTFESGKSSFSGQTSLKSGSFGRGSNTPVSAPISARQFWKSADDSVTIIKANTAINNGPKLTRQGSNFLKKLHEQKDLENQQSQSRLPWAEEGVVVGSLTVATAKPNQTHTPKRHVFGSSPVQSVNKFSHAPMSAFRPIEKKPFPKTPDTGFSGTVRNIAAEKFSYKNENPMLSNTPIKTSLIKKDNIIKSPNSPTLPWTREGFHQNTENRLNSALTKFENGSNNVSSYSKVLKPISTYPQSTLKGSSQQFFENSSTTIPTPPLLSAPNLVQNYNVKSPNENKSNFTQPNQSYSGEIPINRNNSENISHLNNNIHDISDFNHNYNDNFTNNHIINTYPENKYFHDNYNNYDMDLKCMEEFANQDERKPSPQTYSGSVVSRSQIYPDALYKESNKREPSNYIPPPVHINQPPPPPQRRGSLHLSLNAIPTEVLTTPDIIPSPESFTAVSRVMGAAQSHQATTTSHKTRHRKDEFEDVGRFNAARNLTSMLTRISGTPNESLTSPQKSPQKSPLHLVNSESPTNSLSRNRSEPNIASMISDEEYEYYQKQLALVNGSSIAKVPSLLPLQQKYREINTYSNLRTRPASTESLITATSSEARHAETGESVLTTRLQIPVASSGRSGSPLSSLRKSESWHQLHDGIGSKSRRPQSMAIPEGITSSPINTPPQLPTGPRRLTKTKSSHALAFTKQYEAALPRDSIEVKKNKVEAYFKGKTQTSNSPPNKSFPLLDDTLENVDAAFESIFKSSVSSGINSRPGQSMANKSETTIRSTKRDDNSITHTQVTTKTSSFSSATKSRISQAAPTKAVSPFAKFQQMDRQNSSSAPNSPKTPTGSPLFKFTDPKLCRSASGVKDRLLAWCQNKTKEYKNIQIENFSTSWSNGLAFCALIHHFLPDAFDYDALSPNNRRHNFELAFKVADDKAGIAPLLDVEDMVVMRRPDWKCVFTYVQSVYRRFKDED